MLKSNKEKLIAFFRPQKEKKSFFAVKDVSFDVYPGETIGIIGINGSGKSTISNLLAEVIPPTLGERDIDGETSLIAISVGLNNQLSGMENIHLKCMMHGMSEAEIKKVTPEIIEFADIGSFIEQPVKNYSSGMRSRLGFAISVHTNPDIMVVDEALSVGDETFYNKCMDKVNEFKKLGKTIFFVSHSVTQMRKISDRVMWIHYGEMKEFGETNKVLNNYKAFIKWFKELNPKEQKNYKQEMFANQTATRQRGKEATIKKQVDKNATKEQRWFVIQLAVISFIFLIMSTLMISGTPIKTGWNKVTAFVGIDNNKERVIENKAKEPNLTAIPIDKKGYIIAENAEVYDDLDMKTLNKSIDLFEVVHVIEEVGNVYKIDSEQENGYIEKRIVDIEQKVTDSDLKVEELLPYLSEEFKESYLYYLSFMGKEFSDANDKLFYFEVSNGGNSIKTLQSLEDKFKYYAYNSDIITKLEVPIAYELSIETYNFVIDNAIKSIETEQYYIETNIYNYLFDFEEDTITFIMN